MADEEQPSGDAAASGGGVCNFFRKPPSKIRANIRKRRTSTSSSSESDHDADRPEPAAASRNPPKRRTSDNKLIFSSAPSSSSKAEPDEAKPDKVFHFESSAEIQTRGDSRATATLETETDFSSDARAIRERVLKQAEESIKGGGPKAGSEKLYKGIHGYTDYKAGFRREHTVAGEKAGGAHGPLRASAHIRASARFDYQPDICKDYKETGYCGFGDACKFMHDRGDYKSGWQLEKEWEEKEKARKRAMAMKGGEDGDGDEEEEDDSDEDGALPFACFICRRPFEDPVVTKCKHYFCEHCALKNCRCKELPLAWKTNQALCMYICYYMKVKMAYLCVQCTTNRGFMSIVNRKKTM